MTDELSPDTLAERRRHVARSRQTLVGPSYYAVLAWLHRLRRPATYLEIGVADGQSLAMALPETHCVGVDPALRITKPLPPRTQLFETTSTEFFERPGLSETLGGQPLEMAFIDGLHLFEQALLDFINIERRAAPDALVVLHDCLPLDQETSQRSRTTEFYSGDVWKSVFCLMDARPDLRLLIIPAPPTGLCLVTGLDPQSDVLSTEFDTLSRRYTDLEFDDYRMRAAQLPRIIANTKASITAEVTAFMRGPLWPDRL